MKRQNTNLHIAPWFVTHFLHRKDYTISLLRERFCETGFWMRRAMLLLLVEVVILRLPFFTFFTFFALLKSLLFYPKPRFPKTHRMIGSWRFRKCKCERKFCKVVIKMWNFFAGYIHRSTSRFCWILIFCAQNTKIKKF